MVKWFQLFSDPAIPTRSQEIIAQYEQTKLCIVRDNYIEEFPQIDPVVAPPMPDLAAAISPAADIVHDLAAAIDPAAGLLLMSRLILVLLPPFILLPELLFLPRLLLILPLSMDLLLPRLLFLLMMQMILLMML
jgi:hypothetical protein